MAAAAVAVEAVLAAALAAVAVVAVVAAVAEVAAKSRSNFSGKLFKEHLASEYNLTIYIALGSCIARSSGLAASGRITYSIGFAATRPAFTCVSMRLRVAAVGGQ